MNVGHEPRPRRPAASVPEHLHVHVVPRWTGDTNFMTATAEVRALPEALPASARERLRAAWPVAPAGGTGDRPDDGAAA